MQTEYGLDYRTFFTVGELIYYTVGLLLIGACFGLGVSVRSNLGRKDT